MKANNVFAIAGVCFAACKFWETRARKREAEKRKERILEWYKYAFKFACRAIHASVCN